MPRAGSIDYLFQRAHDQLGPRGETIVHPIESVRLHAPRPQGARIACAGGNYADHHLAMAKNRPGGSKEAAELTLQGVAESIRKSGFWGFWKIDRSCLGPDDEINYPARAKYFDYEGEAAIVLGRHGKNIRAEDWKSYVWGVTLLCDWSIRQIAGYRPDELRDAEEFRRLLLARAVHPGRRRCRQYRRDHDSAAANAGKASTPASMVFSFGECLAFLSRDLTLYPGDIISGGTGAGTAQDSSKQIGDGVLSPERFLKVGDVVEVASPQIGVLRNKVVKPSPPRAELSTLSSCCRGRDKARHSRPWRDARRWPWPARATSA